MRWSIRTERIDEVCERLGLVAERRQRIRPDGSLLTWQAAGLELSLRDPWLPFFMQWDVPDDFPGGLSVAHPAGACALSWLRVSPSDPERFTQRTEQDRRLPLRLASGGKGIEAVAIATPQADIVIDNRWCNEGS